MKEGKGTLGKKGKEEKKGKARKDGKEGTEGKQRGIVQLLPYLFIRANSKYPRKRMHPQLL